MTAGSKPLWGLTSSEPDPVGRGSLGDRADIAVIGGGFTGLSTALHAAEAGLEVQLFEAQEIGHGGSGRNVGLVNAGIWLPPSKAIKALGPIYGREFMRRFSAGPETVFALIDKHNINCAPTRTGTIHVAHAASGFADLEARWLDWNAIGAALDLLDRSEVEAKTGSAAFCAGLLDHRAGTINPMAYCRGLARAALAAGARIATQSLVTKVEKQADGWLVHTAKGAVCARMVILATNAYSDALWPGLAASYVKIPYFQLASAPLGARIADILPGQLGLWDTARIMTSLRQDAEGRLIIGSMGKLLGTPQWGISRRWAQRCLARLFPDLGPVEFVAGWHGDIAMTRDHLPRICMLEDGVYTPVGYNGRGITTGTIFGQALAALAAGGDPARLPVPVTRLDARPINRVLPLVYRTVFAVNQAFGGR